MRVAIGLYAGDPELVLVAASTDPQLVAQAARLVLRDAAPPAQDDDLAQARRDALVKIAGAERR